MVIDRAIILVLDSVGIGELPDAFRFGDQGSNTLANVAKAVGGLHIPNLEGLGIGRIGTIFGVSGQGEAKAFYGKMAEVSAGKDTTVGHWEISGIITEKAMPTYPGGFPPEIIEKFSESIGLPILGNKPASGTEIIHELGQEHMETGYPIVYTSADSVFQIAACEETISIESLYEMCKKARALLTGEHNVGRVIARPFIKHNHGYQRTERRRDFSLPPPEDTLLDKAKQQGYEVIGVGKIGDIFAHKGLTKEIHTTDNNDGVSKTIECIKQESRGIIFTNLNDFDMKYGHRKDAEGYAQALKAFDQRLPEMLEVLREQDVFVITADHGCDPTTRGTDHTREYVPLLMYGKMFRKPTSLGVRQSFADVGATVAEALQLKYFTTGKSCLLEMITRSKKD